jgi:hypothetical protein
MKGVIRDPDGTIRGVAQFEPHLGPGGVRLRLTKLEEFSTGDGFLAEGPEPAADELPPIPRARIVEDATRQFQLFFDLRWAPERPEEPLPLLLPAEMVHAARKPRAFYEKVARYVEFCEAHGIAHGRRLAVDNDVAENTVYGWVRKARTMGLLPEVPRVAAAGGGQ